MRDTLARVVAAVVMVLVVLPHSTAARSTSRGSPVKHYSSADPVLPVSPTTAYSTSKNSTINPTRSADPVVPVNPDVYSKLTGRITNPETKLSDFGYGYLLPAINGVVLEFARQWELRDNLARDSSRPAFRSDRLNFSAKTKADKSFDQLKQLLRTQMPGPPPVIGLFLDPETFALPISKFKAVWKSGEPMTEVPADTKALEQYFSSRKGRTVILIGHIEEGSFAFDYGSDRRISLKDAKTIAIQHGVLLLPIGCDTANFGEPLGFKQTIDTDKLTRLLEVVSARHQFGDLLEAMLDVGNVVVDVPSMVQRVQSVQAALVMPTEITFSLFDSTTGNEQISFTIPTTLIPNLPIPTVDENKEELKNSTQNKVDSFKRNDHYYDVLVFLILLGPVTFTGIVWVSRILMDFLVNSNEVNNSYSYYQNKNAIISIRDNLRSILQISVKISFFHGIVMLVGFCHST